MNNKVVKDLIKSHKSNYIIKVKSKRIPQIEWYVIDCVFDEIKRSRVILKAQPSMSSIRSNPSNSIILNLQFFNNIWPLYVYLKDKIVTLPVVDIKVDDRNKIVYLIIP